MVNRKAVRQSIYQKLNVAGVTGHLGGGSAGLVHGVAPPSATYPLCIFSQSSDTSTLRMGGNAFDNSVWLVKGVVRATSSSIAEDIDKAVRDLLDFGTLTISGATAAFLARTSGVDYVETEGDLQYRHFGSLYKLSITT